MLTLVQPGLIHNNTGKIRHDVIRKNRPSIDKFESKFVFLSLFPISGDFEPLEMIYSEHLH